VASVRKATIGAAGAIVLPDEAVAAGYRPGQVVRVVVLSTGSLLVTLDDEPAYDLQFKPLVGGAAQLAMRQAVASPNGTR